jgi:hypothetical protein
VFGLLAIGGILCLLLLRNKKSKTKRQSHEIGSSGSHGISEIAETEKRETWMKPELDGSELKRVPKETVYEVEGDGPNT